MIHYRNVSDEYFGYANGLPVYLSPAPSLDYKVLKKTLSCSL